MSKFILFLGIIWSVSFPLSYARGADFSGDWSGYLYGDWSTLRHEINITIHQNGDEISSTSSYSISGVTGHFGGTVVGNSFNVNFSHTTGECTVSGDAEATLRDTVLVFTANALDCDGNKRLVRGAIVRSGWVEFNYSNWINISQDKYQSNLIMASIWAAVDDVGDDIKTVSLITPLGGKISNFSVDVDETPKEWSTFYTIPLKHLELIWPDGIYVLDITFNDDSHRYSFNMASGEFPEQFPMLTSHQTEDYVDPSVDNTFEWEPWVKDPGVGGTVYFGLAGCCEPGTATSKTIVANSLEQSKMYDFGMNFHFASSYRTSKNVSVRYVLRTGQHVVDDFWLIKGKVRLAGGGEVGMIFAGLEGVPIRSVTLKRQNQIVLLLEPDHKRVGKWETGMLVSLDQLETEYPDGEYSFEITYTDGATESKTVTLSGDYPPVYPEISVPASGETVNWERDFQAAWTSWADFDSGDNMIIISISEASTLPSIPDREVWGENEGLLENGAIVPPGVLPPGRNYNLYVYFVNGTPNQAGKAKGSAVKIRSSGERIGSFPWNIFLPPLLKPK